MYEVLTKFVDLQDKNHLYREGDTYPRDGVVATEERLSELESGNNARKIPLIKKVEAKPAAKSRNNAKRNRGE